MIVEVDNKQIKTNFCMFDGNTFQVWEDKDHGKMVVDIHEDDIERIIIVRKE